MTAVNRLFNDNWQFCLTDIGTELSALSDKKWYNVEIPHDWLIGDTANLYKTGEGWYKKTLTLTEDELSGHVMLNFDGVYFNSTLFVNGKEAGHWTYGYSAFEHDITDYLNAGDNELLLRVEHQSPNTRWYSGAGIYRDVTLKIRPETYIRTNGVYIHTYLDENGWQTEVETAICGKAADITMTLELFAPDGENIAGFKQGVKFGGELESITNHFMTSSPLLWDIDDPNIYTLRVSLYSGCELLDRADEAFGYKTAEFSPEKGLVLNGRQVKMHGVCLHHDLGALGAAYNYAALYRQLVIMKEMGVNAIRTSHNMPVRQLMQICDELGLMVDSESFDMWENSKTEFDNHRFFVEFAERDVQSWVERDRNHPSLIMWCIGNEISDTNDPHGIEITQRLYDYVKKYDPKGNAPATIGSNFMGSENAQKCSDILKLAGYNYSEGMYKEHHEKYPDWTIYGSETASAVRSRGIYHFPADMPLLTDKDLQCSSLDNSVVGWGASARKSWRLDRDCEFCAGQYIWTGFDYIGEPTPYSTKNSYFGIVDTAGFPKDIYYFYQSVWSDPADNPMIHIVPSYWDFNEGDVIDVLIYSNAHTVELLLNGESLGKHVMNLATDENMRAKFSVSYKSGALCAKGYDEKGEVIAEETLVTPSDPVAIVADAADTINADGRDISFVEISVVDKDGNPVGNARNRIKVEVSGAGRLVGLDNGDSTDYDSYKGDSRRLFSGKLLAMVESTLEAGDITVMLSSEGLSGRELTIKSEDCGQQEGVSVVTENAYPVAETEYTDEVPVRKICTEVVGGRELNGDSRTAVIKLKLLPENATYSDISWQCVRRNGADSDIAEIKADVSTAEVTALGDGEFIARAYVNNGGNAPQVMTDVVFTVTGLGAATRSAYSFISANTLDGSNVTVNLVEDGAIGNFQGRTVMTYNNVDFGKTGSETIILHIGTCFDMPVEIYEGTPESGELIERVIFHNNNHWCGFVPETIALSKRLTGTKAVSIVIDTRVTFGGFSFEEICRAFDTNHTAESDSIYGDDYRVDGRSVVDIGNNVIINYEGLDFGENGAKRLTICGVTANPTNQVQLRYTPVGGEQKSLLLEFKHSDSDSEQSFDIPKLCGVMDVSFVFLPGTKFDFKWFRFE